MVSGARVLKTELGLQILEGGVQLFEKVAKNNPPAVSESLGAKSAVSSLNR